MLGVDDNELVCEHLSVPLSSVGLDLEMWGAMAAAKWAGWNPVAASSSRYTWPASDVASASAAMTVPEPASSTRPPHSAAASSAPWGSTPSRTTTTAITAAI